LVLYSKTYDLFGCSEGIMPTSARSYQTVWKLIDRMIDLNKTDKNVVKKSKIAKL
jgi:hypothetical protein